MTDKEKIFSKRLISSLEEANMTQRQLSQMINVSETTISKYVKGRLPKSEILESIAIVLNKTTDYLLGNDKVIEINKPTKSSVIYVPVFKVLKFNDPIDESNNNIERFIPIASERFVNSNALFFKEVQTDEMYPLLFKGDLVLFEAIRPGIDKINTGDICLCTKGDEDAVIRELVNTTNGYVFNLMNVLMPPRPRTMSQIKEEDINIIARGLEIVHILQDRNK